MHTSHKRLLSGSSRIPHQPVWTRGVGLKRAESPSVFDPGGVPTTPVELSLDALAKAFSMARCPRYGEPEGVPCHVGDLLPPLGIVGPRGARSSQGRSRVRMGRWVAAREASERGHGTALVGRVLVERGPHRRESRPGHTRDAGIPQAHRDRIGRSSGSARPSTDLFPGIRGVGPASDRYGVCLRWPRRRPAPSTKPGSTADGRTCGLGCLHCGPRCRHHRDRGHCPLHVLRGGPCGRGLPQLLGSTIHRREIPATATIGDHRHAPLSRNPFDLRLSVGPNAGPALNRRPH